VDECKISIDNKEAKQLVDVALHWGEPHISGVFGFLCAGVIYVMNLISALIIMYDR
jgi:hypothetical protein